MVRIVRSYRREFIKIQEMLQGFVESGEIDATKLSLMDSIIKWSEEDQIKTLNDSYLPLEAQRSFFGAIRNVNISMKSMRKKLESAPVKHENPTTAELALELMPSFFNLAPHIDSLIARDIHAIRKRRLRNVSRFSRILYRKAKSSGFSQDTISQLKEAGVTKSQIESFIDDLNRNVALELDIEEEVSSKIENSD